MLQLDTNRLECIPDSFLQLPLQHLSLAFNPVEDLPGDAAIHLPLTQKRASSSYVAVCQCLLFIYSIARERTRLRSLLSCT